MHFFYKQLLFEFGNFIISFMNFQDKIVFHFPNVIIDGLIKQNLKGFLGLCLIKQKMTHMNRHV